MVERCVRDAEAAGSNPVTSTIFNFLIVLMKLKYQEVIYMDNNSLFSETENKVWGDAMNKLMNSGYEGFAINLLNLMGTCAAIIKHRGFFGNLFKNRKTGILGFKKYAENIGKANNSFEIYKNICYGIGYLKNPKNSPKGALSKENKLRSVLNEGVAKLNADIILDMRGNAIKNNIMLRELEKDNLKKLVIDWSNCNSNVFKDRINWLIGFKGLHWLGTLSESKIDGEQLNPEYNDGLIIDYIFGEKEKLGFGQQKILSMCYKKLWENVCKQLKDAFKTAESTALKSLKVKKVSKKIMNK